MMKLLSVIPGILSHKIPPILESMLPHGNNFTTYIDASYVRWVEAGGARVVPVMVDRDSDDYFMEVSNKTKV